MSRIAVRDGEVVGLASARAFSAKHGSTRDGARQVFGFELGHQPEIGLVR